MKVNMTPNPLDVVTIHASQGDTEARQWEFELHNNGELIDTSEITEQLFFKAYKGGTEQILPENTSTPTTSPFKGDIKYPQGLLSDQEFLYRESPTEEDGLAKITDIKGNTLNWNQLVQNGNFADTSYWSVNNGTVTASNNVLNVKTVAAWTYLKNSNKFQITNGHKYYIRVEAQKTVASDYLIMAFNTYPAVWADASTFVFPDNTNWNKYEGIKVANATGSIDKIGIDSGSATEYNVKNAMIIDLSQLFGIGNEPATVEEFTSLFPLSYYSYNQGSLLSFNGSGIKTVGKNLFDGVLQNGTLDQNGQEQPQANRYRSGFIRVLPNTTYCSSIDGTLKVLNFLFYDGNQNFISAIGSQVVTTPSNCAYVRFFYDQTILNVNLQFEFGSTPTSYEPYVTNTTTLPVSTYFPNGMDGINDVHDELTSSSYVKRTTYIKFDGSQPWSTRTTSGGYVLYEYVPSNIKNVGTQVTAQILNNRYPWNTNLDENKTIRQVNTTISVRRDDITSLQAWYSELASNPLEIVYQLATPIETSFTTASLVTENAEIPLSNEDGVLIGKCTEQLSAEPGFIDAKIKLSDGDGECYSNKIQLHIERSPQ